MDAVRDDGGWAGFWVFAASVAVTAVFWVAARPAVLESQTGLGGGVERR
ncbi:hypothetical protein [Luethyella okanaganae]|uniref:MFS transporter n=1 Tax=Luethyella okanaganae TaxID=69372 RepID=A0ABW1VGD4_9MICO